jgi:hypothetical protein
MAAAGPDHSTHVATGRHTAAAVSDVRGVSAGIGGVHVVLLDELAHAASRLYQSVTVPRW